MRELARGKIGDEVSVGKSQKPSVPGQGGWIPSAGAKASKQRVRWPSELCIRTIVNLTSTCSS